MPAERLYYRDSDLLEFSAIVTDIREARREAGRPVWEISLDRTAFYPTSGGQPADHGTLTARSAGGLEVAVAVEDTNEDDAGEIWHLARKPLQPGTGIRATIDAARRTDHMQQHSGQHLLSACFLEAAGWPTVSFHLDSEVSTIDLRTGSSSADAAAILDEVTALANGRIFADLAMPVSSVSAEEARAMLADGRLRKLPERDGEVRIVQIAGVEHNACGGTHVSSTARIGGISLRGTERIRDSLRVEFCCGLRAARQARRDYLALSAAARALSVPADDAASAAATLQEAAKNAGKQVEKLTLEVARLEAAALAALPGRFASREFPQRSIAFLKTAAQHAAGLAPGRVFVAWSREDGRANAALAAGADSQVDAGSVLKAAVTAEGGKGGGTAALAQGSVPESRLSALLERLEHQLG